MLSLRHINQQNIKKKGSERKESVKEKKGNVSRKIVRQLEWINASHSFMFDSSESTKRATRKC